MRGQPVRIGPLDGLHYSYVEGAPPALEKAPVGHFVAQRVGERVLDIRQERKLAQEFSGLEASDRGVQLILGDLGMHVLPEHRCRLQERLIGSAEPVDAGGDYRLDRRGDLDGWLRAHQSVGPAVPEQSTGLHKRPHALLQKKRIAFRPRDQRVLERFEAGLGPEEGGKKLLSGLRRQRIQPKLRVVGAAAPTVLIFWAVVHDQQQPGSRQALNENIEQCLSLGIDPVEVFEDDQQRLPLAFSQYQPLYCVQGPSATLGRIELLPLRIINRHVEQRQERWQTAFL